LDLGTSKSLDWYFGLALLGLRDVFSVMKTIIYQYNEQFFVGKENPRMGCLSDRMMTMGVRSRRYPTLANKWLWITSLVAHSSLDDNDVQNDIPGHVKVILYAGGSVGNQEQMEFEDDLILALLSHDSHEGFVVSRFRDDNNTRSSHRGLSLAVL
jgi:hypothetical protein